MSAIIYGLNCLIRINSNLFCRGFMLYLLFGMIFILASITISISDNVRVV